jgi:tetraprenyl-beta-curcumene synthase
MREERPNGPKLALTFAAAARCYWLSVFPHVCREIRWWTRRASRIPDPLLRRLALETLTHKRPNLDGAAAFAAFIAQPQRVMVIRCLVAFQIAYDYADTLSEQPNDHPEANSAQLHQALRQALRAASSDHDDYHAYGSANDHGYLADLVDTCRTGLVALPSYPTVAALAQRSASRIIAFQTFNARATNDSGGAYARWATHETPHGAPLQWWETAAAAGSSLPTFALIATAAKRDVSVQAAVQINNAYFPWIGALHTLLDSLIDHRRDVAAGEHSLITHYESPHAMAYNMDNLAIESKRLAGGLPDAAQHLLILTSMASLYLSDPEARQPHAELTTNRLVPTMGPLARPSMLMLNVRHGAQTRFGRGACDAST